MQAHLWKTGIKHRSCKSQHKRQHVQEQMHHVISHLSMEVFNCFGCVRFLRVSLAFRCPNHRGVWLNQEVVNKAPRHTTSLQKVQQLYRTTRTIPLHRTISDLTQKPTQYTKMRNSIIRHLKVILLNRFLCLNISGVSLKLRCDQPCPGYCVWCTSHNTFLHSHKSFGQHQKISRTTKVVCGHRLGDRNIGDRRFQQIAEPATISLTRHLDWGLLYFSSCFRFGSVSLTLRVQPHWMSGSTGIT